VTIQFFPGKHRGMVRGVTFNKPLPLAIFIVKARPHYNYNQHKNDSHLSMRCSVTPLFFYSGLTNFCCCFLLVGGKPYGDENNDLYANDDYEDVEAGADHGHERVIHVLPKFVSAEQNIMVNEGATIKLPCIVNRLGNICNFYNQKAFTRGTL